MDGKIYKSILIIFILCEILEFHVTSNNKFINHSMLKKIIRFKYIYLLNLLYHIIIHFSFTFYIY